MDMIVLDDESSIPKYHQVAEAIMTQVATGRLLPHERLPGELELFRSLGISRSTIRKALEILESRGVIYKLQGRGTYVGDASQVALAPNREAPMVGTLGLLIPGVGNEIYPTIIKGVEDGAATRGWSVFIGNTYGDRGRELRLLQSMLDRGIGGVIMDPCHGTQDTPDSPTWQALKHCPVPLVLLNNNIPGLDLPRIQMDDREGGRLATKQLLSLGHRNFVFVYQKTVLGALERRRGVEDALLESGITPRDEHFVSFVPSDWDSQVPGFELSIELLRRRPRPTAIFYYNDELAMEGLRAIQESGLQVPGDISIMGWDNTPASSRTNPSLSTVEQPSYLSGRWASDIVLERVLASTYIPPRVVTIRPELVLRNSLGPAKQ